MPFKNVALISVTQLVGYHPANRKVTGLITSQGICLGCRFSPQLGHIWKAANQCFSLTLMFLFLSFSLSSLLSKIKNRNKILKRI